MNETLALPLLDPYFWFGHVWFIHENGYLNYERNYTRPPGFLLMCALITSIIDDYYIFYYFMKYIPFFLMSINILVIFVISKRIFKKKMNIMFSLVIFLSFEYLFSRFFMPLTSNLAITFIYLILLFLEKNIILNSKYKNYKMSTFIIKKLIDRNSLLIGILFAGIFMAHGLYILYFIIFYFWYEFFLLIVHFTQNRTFLKDKFVLILKFFFGFLSILFYAILFSLPCIILVSSYSDEGVLTFVSYIQYYFLRIIIGNNQIIPENPLLCIELLGNFLNYIGVQIIKSYFYQNIEYFFRDFLFKLPFLKSYRYFYTTTLGMGIFIIIFGLFIKFKKHFNFNDQQNYLINFMKFTFFFTVLFITIIKLIEFANIDIFQGITTFFNNYSKRIFEMVSGFWAILFVLSVNFIFTLIKKFYFKFKKTNQIPSKHLVYFFKSLQLITIILLGGILYTTNFKRSSYHKGHDDKRIEALLFIGDYFNENSLDERTIILLEDFEYKIVKDLLEYKNLKRKYFEYANETEYEESIEVDIDYSDFIENFNEENCEYILLPKYVLNDDFMEEFENDFNVIYENSRFVFAIID
ncbi:MAG: hypothetical protein ACFFAN_03245 [Promethearchaeota archaeon]